MHLQDHHLERGRQFARNREIARRTAWEKNADRYGDFTPFHPATEDMLEAEARRWAEQWQRMEEEDEARFAAEIREEMRKPIDLTPALERLVEDLRAHVSQGEAA